MQEWRACAEILGVPTATAMLGDNREQWPEWVALLNRLGVQRERPAMVKMVVENGHVRVTEREIR